MTDTLRIPGRRGIPDIRNIRHEPRVHLSRFVGEPAPLPSIVDVTGGLTDIGMLGNDREGDCFPVAVEHNRMTKAVQAGGTFPADFVAPTTDAALAVYHAYGIANGEPGPAPDQGVDPLGYLQWLFAQAQSGQYDVKEFAYAELDAIDPQSLGRAVLDFKGVLCAFDLVDDAEQDFAATPPVPWAITPSDQPDPNEGHGVLLGKLDYGAQMAFVGTWAAWQPVAFNFLTGGGLVAAFVIVTEEDAERASVDYQGLLAECKSLGGVTA